MKKSEAYEAMQAAMPLVLGRSSGAVADPAVLRDAIEAAKEAGVSLVAIRDAENALRKLEEKSSPKKQEEGRGLEG